MLKDKVKYGVSENVVEGAEIFAPKKEYKASALDYKKFRHRSNNDWKKPKRND